jgi:hypothetical protein
MKILVFGMPRTGSTIIQEFLATHYKIDNHVEPYTGDANREKLGDLYHWTSSLSNGVVKILSVNLDHVDFKKLINTANFNFVVLTTRKNLTDSCVSLYYAEIIKQYHFTQLPNYSTMPSFTCPIDRAIGWIQYYKQYQSMITFLKDTKILYFDIDYNDYLNNVPLKINGEKIITVNIKPQLEATVNSNFDYKTLCLNYHEIEKLIYESIS